MNALRADLTTEQRQALWACVEGWKRLGLPPEDRLICLGTINRIYQDRFGHPLHQSWLLALERRGHLVKAHATRGGGRRYYKLANPAMAQTLLAWWGLK
jgi:hypothetical protein